MKGGAGGLTIFLLRKIGVDKKRRVDEKSEQQ